MHYSEDVDEVRSALRTLPLSTDGQAFDLDVRRMLEIACDGYPAVLAIAIVNQEDDAITVDGICIEGDFDPKQERFVIEVVDGSRWFLFPVIDGDTDAGYEIESIRAAFVMPDSWRANWVQGGDC